MKPKLTPKAIALIEGLKPSPKDEILMKRDPRSTLEQAREFEAASLKTKHGITSGFDKLRAQEAGQFHLGGDHT